MVDVKPNPLKRIYAILKFERKEISSIYFYAILAGLVQLSLPLGIQAIISFVLGGSISTSLVLLIILVVVGTFVYGLLQVNQMKIIEKIQQQLFVRYSFHYAHTIPRIDLKSVDSYYLPELVNRFFDTVSLQKSIGKLLLDVPAATIQILFGLLLLSFYHPAFIFFGLLLVFILYLILRFTGNRGLETSLQESRYKYKVAAYLEELARGITSFKFSRSSTLHLTKTDGYVENYLKARTSHFKILLVQYWALVGFKTAITAAMLIVGALLLVNQQLNIGQFIAAEIVILLVIASVEKLIINLDKVYDVLTSVEKLEKLTDKPVDKNGEVKLAAGKEGLTVKAQNLSYEYGDGKPVLKNISFELNAGEKMCVYGDTGSGKSTLLRLISGVYFPYTGQLSINNLPLITYYTPSLRSQMGILLNSQEIFEGTIWENITMGNENIQPDEVIKLAQITGLQPYLDTLPDGLYSELHPQGQHLPSRIVKKMLLMRALAGNARLLLLEEPWLGLENEHCIRIQDYILSLSDTTAIIINNNKQFAGRCHKQMELEGGEVKFYNTNESNA